MAPGVRSPLARTRSWTLTWLRCAIAQSVSPGFTVYASTGCTAIRTPATPANRAPAPSSHLLIPGIHCLPGYRRQSNPQIRGHGVCCQGMALDRLTSRERQIALLDRYGALLTDHQREVLDLHLREDWSLAEIA